MASKDEAKCQPLTLAAVSEPSVPSRHRADAFAPSSLMPLVFSQTMAFQPMPLSRRPLPFDHPEWIFDLKYDGFRSLAVIQNGRTELISRNGHPFSFDLRVALHAGKIVLDGEIVCVDEQGRPQFHDLLFHRGAPCFFAFDLLMADGKDLRSERLTDRAVDHRLCTRDGEHGVRQFLWEVITDEAHQSNAGPLAVHGGRLQSNVQQAPHMAVRSLRRQSPERQAKHVLGIA
jgi:hypothetical protein